MANATDTARKNGAKSGAKTPQQKKKTRKKKVEEAVAETPPTVEKFIAEPVEAPAEQAPEAGTEEVKPKRRSRRACKREVTSSYTTEELHEIDMAQIWVLYREYSCGTIRNFLVEKYYDIVHFTAERMHMRLPNEVEVEDLKSAGLFGLMDAIEAFDTERGVKFETYCGTRIKGAIFDELRAMDWVPRLVRARSSKVDQARRSIEMGSGKKATDDQISSHMQLDSSEYKKVIRDSQPVGVVSLNRKWYETDSSKDVREIDVIKDTKQEDPLRSVQRQDLQGLITKGLTRAERLIVILYYYEEMTMKEIGLTLDLSESRVSQMHSSILARLKAQMQHREKEF
jgi:RNA polymerase sigma factor for flagellar operon FliA